MLLNTASKNNIESYTTPSTLQEAVQTIADGQATVFAGGTDLMVQTQAGVKQFSSCLVNLNRIDELKGIHNQDGRIKVGSLTTIDELYSNAMLKNHAPILADTADKFASGQIRNQATLGGNICNASPAGDMIIPLLLLDASVELASWKDGSIALRHIPIQEFFTGPGKTQKEDNEIISTIDFPCPLDNFSAQFRKFGSRPALDISMVSVGVGAVMNAGVLEHVRVAFGAVAPTPVRGIHTEEMLEGKSLTPETIEKAATTAMNEVSPISDIRASAWYRKELIQTFVKRILTHVMH